MSKPGKGYKFANDLYSREGYDSKGRLMGKLYVLPDSEEGEVTIKIDFEDLHPMVKVHALSEWIDLLNVEYVDAMMKARLPIGGVTREHSGSEVKDENP